MSQTGGNGGPERSDSLPQITEPAGDRQKVTPGLSSRAPYHRAGPKINNAHWEESTSGPWTGLHMHHMYWASLRHMTQDTWPQGPLRQSAGSLCFSERVSLMGASPK